MTERGVIKSAGRVLALFEYLRERREAVTVSDIAAALHMPQSSASMLLRSIETLGYLSYDGKTRKFRPTFRLALLGDWVQDALFENGAVTKAMMAISRACGETIILGQQNKSQVQYLQVIQANYPVRLHLRAGISRPLTCAATGRALLSLKSDKDIRAIVRRNNADVDENWQRVDEAKFMRQIEQVRQRGYAETHGNMTPGASVLAMIVPVPGNAAPLALGIGGPTERIDERREELLALLAKHLRRDME